MAVFVNEGRVADVFGPGRYVLNTQTLPVLTNLMNWDKLFDSPSNPTSTSSRPACSSTASGARRTPVTLRNKDFGIIRMRAFGIYSYKLADPGKFYKEISVRAKPTRWTISTANCATSSSPA